MLWSPQQDRALVKADTWINDPDADQVHKLFGFAGTGKSTLAMHLVRNAPGRWLFGAFTGKAANVMRQKGCFGATTLHSLIYRPAGASKEADLKILDIKIKLLRAQHDLEKDEIKKKLLEKQLAPLNAQREVLVSENKPRFALWAESELNDPDVVGIVVDEVSMVDQYLAADLESFGKKVLVLGDPFQLPPVGAGGYYTKGEPDSMLTEIHRHALDSGILELATMIRNGGIIGNWRPGSKSDVDVLFKEDTDKQELGMMVLGADQVLCGLNATRHAMNHRHRQLLGKDKPIPMVDDRIVCLRNNHALGLYNGSQWVVREADVNDSEKTAFMHVESEEDKNIEVEVEAWMHHFLGCPDDLKKMEFGRRDFNEFDFSYALTVHKSQGSQWNDVLLFDQSSSFRKDAKRWLYTGITRAAKKLTVVL